MQAKVIELRDAGTFIPMLAVRTMSKRRICCAAQDTARKIG